jgi:hypothetical protein
MFEINLISTFTCCTKYFKLRFHSSFNRISTTWMTYANSLQQFNLFNMLFQQKYLNTFDHLNRINSYEDTLQIYLSMYCSSSAIFSYNKFKPFPISMLFSQTKDTMYWHNFLFKVFASIYLYRRSKRKHIQTIYQFC